MSTYNFDKEIERKNTYCEKWDAQGGDYLPLWVADMDFSAPKPVLKAVEERLRHGVFGYTEYEWELTDVIVDYYKKNYQYDINPDWIVWVASVMPGANIACRVCGGSIVYNTPMYPHIRSLHSEVKCPYYEIPLKQENGLYTIDFDLMEKSYTEDMKGFILCNPHNPVGRIYTRAELEQIADFCERHDLLIISDEIHSQLLYDGEHIPAFAINEKAKMRSITLTSAAKTYNIPSMPFAFAIIPNDKIREQYKDLANGLFPTANSLTVKAIKSAYTECDTWREELLEYLKSNRDYIEQRVSQIPGLSINHSEGTYLAWIDATKLMVENPWEFLREKAGVNFSNGKDFGCPGYLRVNFGCTRKTLEEAFNRVEVALLNQ